MDALTGGTWYEGNGRAQGSESSSGVVRINVPSYRGNASHRFEGPLREQPGKKTTQEDQDKQDEQARKEAMDNLIKTWVDRLKQITVITTFFASVESQLVGNTTPSGDTPDTRILQAANAGLVGSLVMHSCAAMISFLATFLLVRYKFKEAKKEEIEAEHVATQHNTASPVDLEKVGAEQARRSNSTSSADSRTKIAQQAHHLSEQGQAPGPPVFSSNPRLERVGPFSMQIPMRLLDRCHTLCLWLSVMGFILAIMGIVCSAWAQMPRSVSVFATACLGVCIAGLLSTLF